MVFLFHDLFNLQPIIEIQGHGINNSSNLHENLCSGIQGSWNPQHFLGSLGLIWICLVAAGLVVVVVGGGLVEDEGGKGFVVLGWVIGLKYGCGLV
jgi:hypothetical protein